MLTVVMYHYVRDLKYSRYSEIKGLNIDQFSEQIKFLIKNYNIVAIEDVIAASTGETDLPPNSVLLTFDDAYIDHFTNVFPILNNFGIKGAFYAPVKAILEHKVLDVNKIHFILASTPVEKMKSLLKEVNSLLLVYKEQFNLESYDYYFDKLAKDSRFDTAEVIFIKRLLQVELPEVLRGKIIDTLFEKVVGIDEGVFSRELYMSLEQIKCMVNAGMHIGSHGYDHYWLGSLSKEKQEKEIHRSIKFLEFIGEDVNNWTICYPYGNYNAETIGILKENGCKLGFTTQVAVAEITSNMGDEIYKIPRLDTNDLPKNADDIPNKWYA